MAEAKLARLAATKLSARDLSFKPTAEAHPADPSVRRYTVHDYGTNDRPPGRVVQLLRHRAELD